MIRVSLLMSLLLSQISRASLFKGWIFLFTFRSPANRKISSGATTQATVLFVWSTERFSNPRARTTGRSPIWIPTTSSHRGSAGSHSSFLVDNHGETQLVPLDHSEASERVWHDGLLAELPTFGLHLALASWTTSFFFSKRTNFIWVDRALSHIFLVNASVLQGSMHAATPLIYYRFSIQYIRFSSLLWTTSPSTVRFV